MAEEFKKGDVVQLKSGGPEMTVYLMARTTLHCQWFWEGKLHTDEFTPEVVKKTKQEETELTVF